MSVMTIQARQQKMDIINLRESNSYDNCIITTHSDSDSSFCNEFEDNHPVANVSNTPLENNNDDLDIMCHEIANMDLPLEDFYNFSLGMLIRTELILQHSDNYKTIVDKEWIQNQILLLKTVFIRNENLFFKQTNLPKTTISRKTNVKKQSKKDKTSSASVLKTNSLEPQAQNEDWNEPNEFQSELKTPKLEPSFNSTLRRSQRIYDRKDSKVILCDKLMYTSLQMQRNTSTPIIPEPQFIEVNKKDLMKIGKYEKKTNSTVKQSKVTPDKDKQKLPKKRAKSATVLDFSSKNSVLQNLSNQNKKNQPFQRRMKAKSLSGISAKDKTDKNFKRSLYETLGVKRDPADGPLDYEIPGPSGITSFGPNSTKTEKLEAPTENLKPNGTQKKAAQKRRAKSLPRPKVKKAKKNEEKEKMRHTIVSTGQKDFFSSSSTGKRKLHNPDSWLHSFSMMNQEES